MLNHFGITFIEGERMTKFLETFLNKLLDFLNVGRLITIVVPGVIISFCVIMFAGQVFFSDKGNAAQPNKAAVKSAKNSQPQPIESAPVPDAAKPDKEALFQKQLSKDFSWTAKHLALIVFFTMILGILIFETGYGLLSFFPLSLPGIKNNNSEVIRQCALTRYDPVSDGETAPTNKFKPNGKDPVFLEYFAPFLKDKFSGDENYYNFIITEYYRFVEFSVVMPLSIIGAALVAVSYWLLFCLRNACCPYGGELVLIFIALLVLPVLFISFVSNRIWLAYQKSQYDLILGVSDLMSKGLTLK
jgi:hypothetical protein